MVKPLVYLAGPISGLYYESAEGWREYAARILGRRGILTLDPLRGKQELRGHVIGADFETAKDSLPPNPMRTTRAVKTRDRWDVRRCDIVLANLEAATAASIGTVMEIAWADSYGVPVVAVVKPKSVHDHGLLTEACGFLVENLDDALNLIPVLLGEW